MNFSNRKYLVTYIIFLGSVGILHAQDAFVENRDNKSATSISFKVSYSYINHNFHTNKNFPHKEIRAGLMQSYSIAPRLSLSGGISVGKKNSRGTYFKKINGALLVDEDYTDRPEAQLFIGNMDNTLSKNRVFIEIPISASFKILPKTSLVLGGSYRFYFPTQNKTLETDFLDNRSAYGVSVGAKRKMGNKFSLSLDYYRGLRNLVYKTYSVAQGESKGRANSSSIGLAVSYAFNQ